LPRCNSCGSELQEEWVFCGSCGRPLDRVTASETPTDAVSAVEPGPAPPRGATGTPICHRCGAPVLGDDRFCQRCGAPVGASVPSDAAPSFPRESVTQPVVAGDSRSLVASTVLPTAPLATMDTGQVPSVPSAPSRGSRPPKSPGTIWFSAGLAGLSACLAVASWVAVLIVSMAKFPSAEASATTSPFCRNSCLASLSSSSRALVQQLNSYAQANLSAERLGATVCAVTGVAAFCSVLWFARRRRHRAGIALLAFIVSAALVVFGLRTVGYLVSLSRGFLPHVGRSWATTFFALLTHGSTGGVVLAVAVIVGVLIAVIATLGCFVMLLAASTSRARALDRASALTACPNCGAPPMGNDVFCGSCGQPLAMAAGSSRTSAARLLPMLTCVVLLLGVAGGVLLALKRPASTPITPVEGFVAAVNQHDLGGALGYIDPTDRALLESTGTVSGLTQLFETGALSRVQVDDLTIDNVKIEGSHAFIELRAKTCEQGSGCNGSARTAFSDFDLPATDLGSGNLDIPCEIVGTNWYLYGGTATWALSPNGVPPTTTTTTTLPSTTSSTSSTTTSTTLLSPPVWQVPETIDGGASLIDVSCPAPSFCVAVDAVGRVVRFGPTRWGAPQSVGTGPLDGISCVNPTFCVAVGGSDAVTFDRFGWSSPSVVDPGGSLLDISCPDVDLCTTVDASGNAFLLSSSGWSEKSIDPGEVLHAVSCPSADFCVAVDGSGEEVTYSNGQWLSPQLIDSGNVTTAVSCTSSSFCVAVDQRGGIVEYDNSAWNRLVIDGSNAITSVSCLSAGDCLVVDDVGNAFRLSGGSWSGPQDIDGAAHFQGISCASRDFCSAVGDAGQAATFESSR
jgi:predicted amidophosphoribosyltransferase